MVYNNSGMSGLLSLVGPLGPYSFRRFLDVVGLYMNIYRIHITDDKEFRERVH